MNKILKKQMAFLLLFFFIISAGCGNRPENTDASSISADTSGDHEVIHVGILSIDDSLPLVVADKEGMFAEKGLKVELHPFKSSLEQSQAMEAGELDVVMNDMIVQGLMKKSGTDTRVVSYAFGATPEEGRFVVVASPKSGIKSAKDLYGKKVAISNNTMMDFLLAQYEKHLDLDSEKITKVNMPDLILRMETVLAGKDIDAAILPDPLASFAIQKGAIEVIDDTKLGENFSQSVILAKSEMINDRKNDLQIFMDVYFSAMKKINEQPNDYRELALENGRVPDTLKDEYQMPHFTPAAVPTETEVDRVTSWLSERGLSDKKYAYDEMVNTDFVKKK